LAIVTRPTTSNRNNTIAAITMAATTPAVRPKKTNDSHNDKELTKNNDRQF